jgi:hypothetical protein
MHVFHHIKIVCVYAAATFFAEIKTQNGHKLIIKSYSSHKVFYGDLDMVNSWIHDMNALMVGQSQVIMNDIIGHYRTCKRLLHAPWKSLANHFWHRA